MESNRLKQLLAFHTEDPDDPFVRFALASEYVKLGDLQTAESTFRALRAHAPDYVGLYFHFGKLLEQMNRAEEALEIYREGIAIATQIPDFHARSELQSALLEAEMSAYD